MLSKNPLDLLRKDKFSDEELSEALRLAIIAELDAINLYLQLARLIDKEEYKRVFLDIAREEKTHVGEFLSLLKTLDKEQVKELKKGLEEVKELTSLEPPNDPVEENSGYSDVESFVRDVFTKLVDKHRLLRKYFSVEIMGAGTESILVNKFVDNRESTTIIPLTEVSVEFRVKQRTLDYILKTRDYANVPVIVNAASKFAYLEDTILLKGCKEFPGLLNVEGVISETMSDWSKPGSAIEEIARAYSKILGEGVRPPLILLINPQRYTKLLSVHERTGVMELNRVKEFVKDVVVVPYLPTDTALLLAVDKHYIDLVVGVDTRIDYIGLDNGEHVFRAWETLALRIKYPKAIAVLKQQ